MPKISVVMSVYKEPVDWMRQSIDSILNQTYTDFEFIIINDKPDREENTQLLNEYAQRDNRIKIITNEENIGLTKSLNKGISIAKGEYIARMDADDISLPERFERQLNFFKAYPAFKFCATRFSSINENGELLKKDTNGRFNDVLFLYRMNPIGHSSVMFHSELLNMRTPLYNEIFICEQDVELWSMFLSNGVKMHILPECLVKYRFSSQQISNKKNSNREYSARTVRRNLIRDYLITHGLIESAGDENLEAYLNCIENQYNELLKDDIIIVNSMIFVLYHTLIQVKSIYKLKYLFSKRLYIFRLNIKDSVNILFNNCGSKLL